MNEKLLEKLEERLIKLKEEQEEMPSGFLNGMVDELESIIKMIKQLD